MLQPVSWPESPKSPKSVPQKPRKPQKRDLSYLIATAAGLLQRSYHRLLDLRSSLPRCDVAGHDVSSELLVKLLSCSQGSSFDRH